MNKRSTLPAVIFGVGLAGFSSFLLWGQNPPAAVANPWVVAQVLHANDLAAQLAVKQVTPPQILQIGFAALYKARHIPGTVYAGPASTDEGLANLKSAVASMPKDRQIVLYCGCCPFDKCPNIRPAFKLLQSMGYTKIKVLELPTNFATDWVAKGFPADPPAASPQ